MRGSILGRSKIVFSSPKRRDKLWGPPRLVGVERASVEVKNDWSYITTARVRPHVVERDSFTLCFLITSYWEMSARYLTMAVTWVSVALFLVYVCNVRPHLNHVIQRSLCILSSFQGSYVDEAQWWHIVAQRTCVSARSRSEPVNRAARATAEQQRITNHSASETNKVAVKAGGGCWLDGRGYVSDRGRLRTSTYCQGKECVELCRHSRYTRSQLCNACDSSVKHTRCNLECIKVVLRNTT
jgi:hypothetical protein